MNSCVPYEVFGIIGLVVAVLFGIAYANAKLKQSTSK